MSRNNVSRAAPFIFVALRVRIVFLCCFLHLSADIDLSWRSSTWHDEYPFCRVCWLVVLLICCVAALRMSRMGLWCRGYVTPILRLVLLPQLAKFQHIRRLLLLWCNCQTILSNCRHSMRQRISTNGLVRRVRCVPPIRGDRGMNVNIQIQTVQNEEAVRGWK